MDGASPVQRLPAIVRRLRARLRGDLPVSNRTGSSERGEAATTDGGVPTTGYFCRTCGTGFRGRHSTCPQCGGGMIERGVDGR